MLRFLLTILSKFPLPVLYLLSSACAWFGYHILKYRREVIFENIERSFPDSTRVQNKKIAKEFYEHFFQMMVEVLKSKGFTEKDWKKRVQVENIEAVSAYLNAGKSVIIMSGHVANWEWSGAAVKAHLTNPVTVLYKKMKESTFSKEIQEIRERGGVRLVEKDTALKHLVKTRDEHQVIGMISDQIPSIGAEKYWLQFLNQETAFYRGAEKFSQLLRTPVFYADMQKIKKGYYQLVFSELHDGTAGIAEGQVVKGFVERLEQTIQARPADFLWSHRRWKYTKEEAAKATGKPFVFID